MTPKSDRTNLATRALSEPGANPASAHLTRQPGQVSRQTRGSRVRLWCPMLDSAAYG